MTRKTLHNVEFCHLWIRHVVILLEVFVMITLPTHAEKQTPIQIWNGTNVSASSVTLEAFLSPYGNKSPAVIVCPGGSFCWLDYDNEGVNVAKWLQQNGISAFVLRYRTAGVFAYITHYRILCRGNQYPDMLEDIQRAIQLLRENATKLSIDPNKIGVMGFSAGGYLAMASGIYFDTDYLKPVGITTRVSLRPDFVAAIYPVVSMSDACTHKRSRRGLMGDRKKRNKEMRDSLSLERHVKKDTPPSFVVNCVDDPTVKYHNSELLDSSLTAKGVCHRYIQYSTGGHGFGVAPERTSEEAIRWKEEFLIWIKEIFRY